MVKFLINRPIAVLMSFLALIIFSALAISQLPISLLPDTEVPKLTISIVYPNASPQEIERNVLQPIRESYGTLNGLEDIESLASYEYGSISLTFSYSTSMDLAYISANEKMDRLMNHLPKDLVRPQIIKANTSDIPIIKIQATPGDKIDLVALSDLVVNVIKKRVEQVKGVSLVDINGIKRQVISIEPHQSKLNALGLTNDEVISTIRQNNQSLGGISVKDGQYRYFIKISNLISDIPSIRSLALKTRSGEPVLLSQVAKISKRAAKDYGYHLYNQKESLVLNVHKQASARMIDLVPLIKEQVKLLNKDYPEIEFTTTQDQSTLLDVSINNLTTSLIIGGSCAFIILFLFMANAKIPLIIGISLPSSLLLAFLLFWAFDLSINIVSLSGLALGLGMLIDNAIIVIDNITRKRREGQSLIQSCTEGVEEVISPLISSVLTTLAVFVPLIFLGGTSGALFYDQALSVAAILGVSLLVAFILLPVLYRLFFIKDTRVSKEDSKAFLTLKKVYKNRYHWLSRHQSIAITCILIFTALGLWLSSTMKTEGLPPVNKNEKELIINWNEPITVEENKKRVHELFHILSDKTSQMEADIGISQYLLQTQQTEIQSARLLIDFKKNSTYSGISTYLNQNFPEATYSLTDAPNAFDQIFSTHQPYFEARLRSGSSAKHIPADFGNQVAKSLPYSAKIGKGFQEQSIITLKINYDKLSVYNINQAELLNRLNQVFGDYRISDIKSFDELTPIYLIPSEKSLLESLNQSMVKSMNKDLYPIGHFVQPEYDTDFKYVVANQSGRYQSLEFGKNISVEKAQNELKQLAKDHNYLIQFGGEYFKNKEDLSRLVLVLCVSIMLLYFILVAQFESFTQPLIVILTLPVGIAGSIYALYITGATINIMSGIGVIIMLGIIVNDSILKIDTINRLRAQGNSINDALLLAGSMRLKPILMTSITTILALLPILFFSGLGTTLQTPLVYAVTGGLIVGTIASIFFIPLLYKLVS